MRMTKKLILAAGTCLLAHSAFGHKTDAADNVAAAADNTADMMEANASAVRDMGDNMASNTEAAMDNRADKIENNADAVRAAGENQADAMDKAAKKKSAMRVAAIMAAPRVRPGRTPGRKMPRRFRRGEFFHSAWT